MYWRKGSTGLGNIPKKYQIFFSASLIFKCQVLYRGSSLPDKISSTELYRLRNFALSGKKVIIFKDANSPKAFQNKTCLTAPVFSSLFNVPQDIMDAWIMSIFWFHWWLKWVKTVCRCCFFAPNVNIFRGHFLLIPIIFWKIVDLYDLEKDYFCITKNSF